MCQREGPSSWSPQSFNGLNSYLKICLFVSACYAPKCHKFCFLTEFTVLMNCVNKCRYWTLSCGQAVQKDPTTLSFFLCRLWWVLAFAPLARHNRRRLKLCKADCFAKLTGLTGEYCRERARRRRTEASHAVLTGSWHSSDLHPHL